MNQQSISLFDFWEETIDVLTHEGLLLCSADSDGNDRRIPPPVLPASDLEAPSIQWDKGNRNQSDPEPI